MYKLKTITSVIYEKSAEEENDETRYINIQTNGNDEKNKNNSQRSFITNIQGIKLKDYENICDALNKSPKEIQAIISQEKEKDIANDGLSSRTYKHKKDFYLSKIYQLEETQPLKNFSNSIKINFYNNSNQNTINSNDNPMNNEKLPSKQKYLYIFSLL